MSDEERKAPKGVELPAFDPRPSVRFAVEVLTEVGVPFALIGRVAMWTLLQPEQHEFTKNVDFAVPVQSMDGLRAALGRRGIVPRPLPIGGIAVRQDDIRVDFIDRHEGGLAPLFEEAIAEADRRGGRASVGDMEIPVVTPEYFVAIKVVAAEDRDEEDAVRTLRARPELDLARTREILSRHGGPGSANRLDALARRAGRADARPEYRNSG